MLAASRKTLTAIATASGEAACTLDACRARLMPDADLVLEGGGMKGIGLGGAVTALMRAGYAFPRVAGTSAGAIVAAFLAAGIGERGLVEAMARLRYDRVPDRGLPKIPIISEGCRCCTPPAPTGATTSAASCATSSSASACGPSATCVAATAAMT